MTAVTNSVPDLTYEDVYLATPVGPTAEELKTVKITAISDLHGYLPPIPDTDILILAGDLSPVYMSHGAETQLEWWYKALGPWVSSIRASYKIVIGGNHDFAPQYFREGMKKWAHQFTSNGFGKITYLCDEATHPFGIPIYGYPWVPNLTSWAFYADENTLRQKAYAIPADTEILVTHGGPQGMGDKGGHGQSWTHFGDAALRETVIGHHLPDLKLHIFGHIHEAWGQYGLPGRDTAFHNVAYLDRDYCTTHPLVQYEKKDGKYTWRKT